MLQPGDMQLFLDALAEAERRTQGLASALLAGHPDLIASASQEVQQAAVALSGSLQVVQRRGSLALQLKQRLRRLGQDLAMQREACLRRSAVVDRALNSIIPSARPSTYAGGARPYGQQARRSGAFTLISA